MGMPPMGMPMGSTGMPPMGSTGMPIGMPMGSTGMPPIGMPMGSTGMPMGSTGSTGPSISEQIELMRLMGPGGMSGPS
jgi:hypothetical protein